MKEKTRRGDTNKMIQQDNRRVKEKKEDAAKKDKTRSRRQVLEATIRPASPALHCGATEWGMLADLDTGTLEQTS